MVSSGISATDPGGILNGRKGVGVPLKLSGSFASRMQLNKKRKRPFDRKPTSLMCTSLNSRDGSDAQRALLCSLEITVNFGKQPTRNGLYTYPGTGRTVTGLVSKHVRFRDSSI